MSLSWSNKIFVKVMGISFIKANFKKLCVVRLQDFKSKLMQNLQNLSLFFLPLFVCVCVEGGVSFF